MKVDLESEVLHKEEKMKYNSLYKDLPILVEGPDRTSDHSFFLNHMCEDLAALERGIRVEEFVEKLK